MTTHPPWSSLCKICGGLRFLSSGCGGWSAAHGQLRTPPHRIESIACPASSPACGPPPRELATPSPGFFFSTFRAPVLAPLKRVSKKPTGDDGAAARDTLQGTRRARPLPSSLGPPHSSDSVAPFPSSATPSASNGLSRAADGDAFRACHAPSAEEASSEALSPEDTLLVDDIGSPSEGVGMQAGAEIKQAKSHGKNRRLRHVEDAGIEGTQGLLRPAVVHRLRALGVSSLFSVQRQVLSHVLQGSGDALVLSPTGTGKTLAFLIPLLQRIEEERWPRTEPVLVVAPTRELAEQIAFEAWRLRTSPSTEVSLVFGASSSALASASLPSSSAHRQREAEEAFLLRSGAHVVVGTPGRLRELLEKKHVLLHADRQKFVVLDEADKLLSRGLVDDVAAILRATQNPDRRLLAFSATFPKWLGDCLEGVTAQGAEAASLKKRHEAGQEGRSPSSSSPQRSLRVIDLCRSASSSFSGSSKAPAKGGPGAGGPHGSPAAADSPDAEGGAAASFSACQPNIAHLVCRLPRQDAKRIRALLFLLKARLLDPHPDLRGIVFCNSRQQASLLAHHPLLEPVAKPLHADMPQSQRSATLRAFARGDFPILIATDLAARGLDLPRVGLVVHYGVPQSSEVYVHRAGRTGRPKRLSEKRQKVQAGAGLGTPSDKMESEDSIQNDAWLGEGAEVEESSAEAPLEAAAADGGAFAWTATLGRQKNKQRTKPQQTDATADLEETSEASQGVSIQRGESILLLDRGQQQGSLLRKFEKTVQARFRELDAPEEDDMVQHSLREIESQLLSPQVQSLLPPFLPFASKHLATHGPRLLAAALVLLLQRQQRITWRSALSGRFNFTPLLFHDPFFQHFKRKEDLMSLLHQVLPPHLAPASNIGRIAYSRKGLLVDLPSGAARAVLASEEVKRRKIKVTFAATLPHVVGDELRARMERARRQRDPEKVMQELQKRIHNARSKRARMYAPPRRGKN
ncbi:DEAD/DEAH box helicase domain-containing protein [Besnoitia besnoiti]|uniref:RNA helicase n=1 Tax=Besnoitia besnoiti TaxID=94643 RepID=A0A2A9MGM5_BESBE|nr:DEAD/DEAH box helicase domain-containing protein [Besnoitia besnoiti]PFH37668.1 DEAD/DEAH box helicase domain-containing protein [Besnoitia besnoiti]